MPQRDAQQKRLTEATEFGKPQLYIAYCACSAGSDSYDFTKNEDDPLDIDVIIIDEASMPQCVILFVNGSYS